jgi:hypothetical protein
MKGDKIKPVVIGGAKKPRCFKNKNLLALNITYLSNKKSWMTLQTFNFWLEDLNQKMINDSRNFLLLLDNAPVHPISVQYTNIELFYFHSNVTSLIQPLDQGIIKNFKVFYKKEI